MSKFNLHIAVPQMVHLLNNFLLISVVSSFFEATTMQLFSRVQSLVSQRTAHPAAWFPWKTLPGSIPPTIGCDIPPTLLFWFGVLWGRTFGGFLH